MTNKVLAVIPARGGSKGIPRKNIIEFYGKPLIAWTIESSINSPYITKTIVSSDDYEILNIAKAYQADTIKRPDNLATDFTTSEPVVKHAIDKLRSKGLDFDYITLLQPTSPLRDVSDINNAFKLFYSSDATALISVYKVENKILKAFKKNKIGYIEGISNNLYPFMRRQNLPTTYMSNGAIYIIKVNDFLKNNSFLTKKTVHYKMDKIKSIDIDTISDLKVAENYFHGTPIGKN